MKTFDLKGSKRENIGSKFAKEIRKAGNVPAVVYGNGTENINFVVSAKELKGAIITPEVYIVNLNIDGKVIPSVIKDVDFHPVTDEVVHIDFYAIKEDKELIVKLPIEVVGHAPGVKAGGKLIISSRKLKSKGLPANLPDRVVVSVETLELDKAIKVGDLKFDNFEIVDPKDMLVCRVKTTRAAQAAARAAEDDGKKKKKK